LDIHAHRVELPLPPSVNALWRSGGGRVYRSERSLNRAPPPLGTQSQRPGKVSGPVAIVIGAGNPIGGPA